MIVAASWPISLASEAVSCSFFLCLRYKLLSHITKTVQRYIDKSHPTAPPMT